ncbi:MAG: DUF5668 domain-containing protein [Anaerolineaceae bacterium]|nr:DUF5668 domain-containing protein [Anaerolineaceae bacterium]
MPERYEERPFRRYHRPNSIFGPLLLITVGIFLFLNTFDIINGSAWDIFLIAWPVLFILSGIDGLFRGDGYVGAVVLVGAGTLFLLGNMDYLTLGAWDTILRIWPVFLVVWGLDLLIGRRTNWSALFGILMGLVVVAGIYWLAVLNPVTHQGTQVETITQPLKEADQANVTVEAVAGKLTVGGGAESVNLAEGSIELAKNESFEQDYSVSDGQGEFNLTSGSAKAYPFVFLGPANQLEWNLELNPKVPIDLESKIIVGELHTNLSKLNINDFSLETIIGKSVLYLPAHGDFEGNIKVVIGEMVIYLLEGTPLRIETDTAITSINIPDDFTRTDNLILSPEADNADEVIKLRIEQPIGSIRIRYVE